MQEEQHDWEFNARVRLAIDERAHPEAVEFLRSIPTRKLSTVITGLLIRAIPSVNGSGASPVALPVRHAAKPDAPVPRSKNPSSSATPANADGANGHNPYATGLGGFGEVSDEAFTYGR